ncbi:hypothetical protein QTO34_000241 [Cnephaeus nilssonii]|uniref:Uncharacterized protein n=1 Tax=Cnephaeus nilssonii TaxID=3371016 RepID=A0AA40IC74_CNENI|nr:hypothetical protein QTO34_000241 [Eptesicus nilssonii]
MKRSNIRIIGVPEQQEEEQRLENLFEEIMSENFPDVGKKKSHTSTENPKQDEPEKTHTKTHHNYDGKCSRQRENLKGCKRETEKTHEARKEWKEIYKVMQRKGLNPRILYSARLSFKIEGETRSFTDKKKAKGVYHYQASNARNAKGTGVKRRNKKSYGLRREDRAILKEKNQEEMKKNQEEMKNDITAVKNSLESIKSRLEEAEDRISELEDKVGENTK